MIITCLSSMSYVPIIVSAIVYFLLGSLWFSTLFGKIWVKELEKHNVIIKQPTPANMMLKMGITFLGNFVTVLAMACLVHATGSVTICSGLHLGLVAALGFAATAMGVAYNWESRSVRLFLIDIGYPVLGIVASAIILSLWR